MQDIKSMKLKKNLSKADKIEVVDLIFFFFKNNKIFANQVKLA